MAAKAIFVLCASALVAQSALGQCLSRMAAPVAPYRAGLGFEGLAYDGLGLEGAWSRRAGCGTIAPAVDLTASHGGSLSVSSASANPPTGLAVTSENAYEGPVAISGNLPYLGTANIEGVFPTAGTGDISYVCGDGAVGITAEGPIDATITPAIAPAVIAPSAFASAAVAPPAMTPAAISPASMSPWGNKILPSRPCGCGIPSFY